MEVEERAEDVEEGSLSLCHLLFRSFHDRQVYSFPEILNYVCGFVGLISRELDGEAMPGVSHWTQIFCGLGLESLFGKTTCLW